MSFSITKTQGYGKRRSRDVRIAANVPVYLFLTQGVITISQVLHNDFENE